VKVLVTGGAGYIGTHLAVQLTHSGHEVVLLDNLVNSSAEAVNRVERIVGGEVPCYIGDCGDPQVLGQVFTEHPIDAVVHCAALKAVGESTAQPLRYFRNNLDAAITLTEVMDLHGVRSLVFSSSATVYGDPEQVPIPETAPLKATNPYGATKLFIEEIFSKLAAADPTWRIALLRYFNPIGAHPSGLIGEDPQGEPNNLFPYIAQVATGRREHLKVFGADYPTPDGTGVRDYLHIMDLVDGHIAALERLGDHPGSRVYNLGTGQGMSVMEAIKTFEEASGQAIPHVITDRRPGDIAVCYADPSRAEAELGWRARRSLLEACADTWRWQSQNPNGFADAAD
jgi:UDP-glucose 4-epimerase